MKLNNTLKLLFLLIFNTVFAQENQMENTKQHVLLAQNSRFNAMIEGDVETLKNVLADELTYAHTTGWIETKSGFITSVASKKIDYLSIKSRDLNVRIYDNTAIITGLADVKLTFNNNPMAFTIRFLEVEHYIDNLWQLVAWQAVKNLKN